MCDSDDLRCGGKMKLHHPVSVTKSYPRSSSPFVWSTAKVPTESTQVFCAAPLVASVILEQWHQVLCVLLLWMRRFFFYYVWANAASRGVPTNVHWSAKPMVAASNLRTTVVTFSRTYSWALIERTISPQVHIAVTSINRPVKQTHWTNAVGKASYPHCRWWMYAHDVYVYVCVCKDLHSALRSHRKLPHRYIAHGAMQRHCLYNYVTGATSHYETRFQRPFLDPARLVVCLLHCGVSTCAVVWFDLHFLCGIVWL